MFVFPVGVLLEELSRHAPEILEPTARALRSGIKSEDCIELGPEFGEAPARPIDVAVMEPTDRAAVVPLDAGWSDVGSWESLWELGNRDQKGNVVVGDVLSLDATDNYLRSEGPLVAVIGVEGLVVVATHDSVLVVPRERAQDVKNLVEMIEDRPQGK
jgi:mannose-1-phosphate guanylyltransferase